MTSLGYPCKFQLVSRLGSVTACTASSSGRQPNFVALNRGRHLYSSGRPSRWALAHISSLLSCAIDSVWMCCTARHLGCTGQNEAVHCHLTVDISCLQTVTTRNWSCSMFDQAMPAITSVEHRTTSAHDRLLSISTFKVLDLRERFYLPHDGPCRL